MYKIPENKTRKKLRIAQCVLYLVEIFLCTFPYLRIPNSDGTKWLYRTVLDMLSYMGGNIPREGGAELAFLNTLPYFLLFFIIPIAGFFFCALDKKSNMKNIASIICCVLGVISILIIVSVNFLTLFSVIALLLYILISFITTFAMMSRLSADSADK